MVLIIITCKSHNWKLNVSNIVNIYSDSIWSPVAKECRVIFINLLWNVAWVNCNTCISTTCLTFNQRSWVNAYASFNILNKTNFKFIKDSKSYLPWRMWWGHLGWLGYQVGYQTSSQQTVPIRLAGIGFLGRVDRKISALGPLGVLSQFLA